VCGLRALPVAVQAGLDLEVTAVALKRDHPAASSRVMTSSDDRLDRRHFIQSVTAGIAGLLWPMRGLTGERQWTAIQKL
jgi:hypothetical protein